MARAKEERTTQALDGVRVVDLSRFLPGSYCTMLLGDMGAEVIQIQEPREHDIPFGFLPSTDPEVNTVYDASRRNKLGIVLDLKMDEGKQVFYRLVENADVVVEGFRPGVAKRLTVDYETVRRINPRIIYCSITGYGQDGPYSMLAGHDRNYLSISGILGKMKTDDGQFVLPAVPFGDVGGGSMHAVVGILFALIAREKTGRGQFVDVSMTDGLTAWNAIMAAQRFFAGIPSTEEHAPPPHVYRTKDGKYICFQAREPWFWERTCRALGLEEYIPYHRDILPEEPDSLEKRREITARLAQVFLTRTRDEWFRLLTEADCEVSPVYTQFEEVFSDPQTFHRQMMIEVDHPRYGKIRQVGFPIKLSDTPAKFRYAAPLRGQHTEQIMLALGYSGEEIKSLRQSGAVK